jgi:ABC-type polar amino acid transport system ATPase subunit
MSEDITNKRADKLVSMGIGFVPQNNNVFPSLTIEENLQMGAFQEPKASTERFDEVAGLFPALAQRRKQRAGSLSGGERQMVAMARALMMEPKVLLLDEPSAGLSPALTDEAFVRVKDINKTGVTVIMVEQNARRCLQICDRGIRAGPGPQRLYRHRPGSGQRPEGRRTVPGDAGQGLSSPQTSLLLCCWDDTPACRPTTQQLHRWLASHLGSANPEKQSHRR